MPRQRHDERFWRERIEKWSASGLSAIATCLGSSSSLAISPLLLFHFGFRPTMLLLAAIATLWTLAFSLLARASTPFTERFAPSQNNAALRSSRSAVILTACCPDSPQ